jgi:Protein of unknown function (DUF3618)
MTDTNLSQDELEAQIELQRAQLADTVEQLGEKLDVKAQASALLGRIDVRQVALAAGVAVTLGALVWWRRGR